MNESSEDRRRTSLQHALFRSTADEVIALTEALPEDPAQTDLKPLEELLRSVQVRLQGDRELEHRMRNLVTVTNLSIQLDTPADAVHWIKQAARVPG